MISERQRFRIEIIKIVDGILLRESMPEKSVRKTKIVCTLGPSTDSEEMIRKLIEAGADVFRLNFSFGTTEYHLRLINLIREVSEDVGRHVAILQDLAGPKVRIGRLSKAIMLHQGEMVKFKAGDVQEKDEIPVSHPEISEHLKEGDFIYLADGAIKLKVKKVEDAIRAEVIDGGVLTSYKGLNIPGMTFESPITEKDRKDLEFGIKMEVDWIAVSFVRSAEDVRKLKYMITAGGSNIPVIAKIERGEAVKNLENILYAADGIMVARGDLGVELSLEEVPVVQKKAIEMANRSGKPVITATQMLKFMVMQPSPTRAEVTDVANAVLDGTDAVMLSEETATGAYPVETVRVMDRIIRKAETIYRYLKNYEPRNAAESIASSAARISMNLGVDATIVFTRTGASAIQLSRYRSPAPILVAAHDTKTLRRIALVWGCVPLKTVPVDSRYEELIRDVVGEGLRQKYLKKGGRVVITSGYPFGEPGTTNTLKVLESVGGY